MLKLKISTTSVVWMIIKGVQKKTSTIKTFKYGAFNISDEHLLMVFSPETYAQYRPKKVCLCILGKVTLTLMKRGNLSPASQKMNFSPHGHFFIIYKIAFWMKSNFKELQFQMVAIWATEMLKGTVLGIPFRRK